MSIETKDPREIEAVRETVKQRVEDTWKRYHDRTLNQQMDELTLGERRVVDIVVSEFLLTELLRQKTGNSKIINDIVVETKPVGAKREKEGGGSEAYPHRIMHRQISQEGLQGLDMALTKAWQDKFDVLNLPSLELSHEGANIVVQILPVGTDNIVIRGKTRVATDAAYDHRGSMWSFNILARTDSQLYRFLQMGQLGKLLPFIVRNMITAINPEAAVFCDAGVQRGGRMDVIDFKTNTSTYYAPSDSLSGNTGYQQKFANADLCKAYIREQSLGSPIQPAIDLNEGALAMFGNSFVPIKEGFGYNYNFSSAEPLIQ